MSKSCHDWVFEGKIVHKIGQLVAKLNKQDIYSDPLGIILEWWSIVEYKKD